MAVNKDFKVKNGAIIGGDISVPSGNIFVQHTAGQYSAFRGAASQSANVVIQGDGGNGSAYWISAKQSDGALHIGGNGGTEPALGALTINGSGYVGIGIAAPLNKLHVVSTDAMRSAIFETTAGTTSAIMLKNTASVVAPQLLSVNDDMAFQTNGTARMRITSTGHVGIATTAPVTGTGFPVFTVGATRPISLVSGLGGSSVYGSALTVNMAIDTSTGTPTATVGAGTSQQGGTAMVTDYTGNITFHSYNTGLETGGTRTVNMYDVTRMRIASDGDVQLGGATTNPFGGRLLVQKATGQASVDVYNVSTGDAGIRFYNANNNSAIMGGDGSLKFYANSAATERMRLTSDGNLGLGLVAPTSNGSTFKNIEVRGTAGGGGFLYAGDTAAKVRFGYSGASGGGFIGTLVAEPVVFQINSGESMRLTSNGKLNIGDNQTAYSELHVRSGASSGSLSLSGAGGASYLLMGNQDSGGVTGPSVIVASNRIIQFGVGDSYASRSGGAFTEHMRLQEGNLLVGTTVTAANGRLHAASTNSSNGLGSGEQVLILRNTVASASARGAGIRFDMGSYTSGAAQIDLINTGNANDGNLSFSTRSSGTIAERMIINSSGVTVNGTLTETSTIRVKENVRDLEGSLAKVLGLRGVMYDMKDGSALNQVGLIAEEVHAVVPNVVYRDEDGEIAGVQYARLVAVLIEGMKEQEARIKHLEALVAKLVD